MTSLAHIFSSATREDYHTKREERFWCVYEKEEVCEGPPRLYTLEPPQRLIGGQTTDSWYWLLRLGGDAGTVNQRLSVRMGPNFALALSLVLVAT